MCAVTLEEIECGSVGTDIFIHSLFLRSTNKFFEEWMRWMFWGEFPSDCCNSFSINQTKLSYRCHWDSLLLCPTLDWKHRKSLAEVRSKGTAERTFRIRKNRSDLEVNSSIQKLPKGLNQPWHAQFKQWPVRAKGPLSHVVPLSLVYAPILT